MKKYNLSEIMKRAWEIKKENENNIFSACLKLAWAEAKNIKTEKETVMEKLEMMAKKAEERYVFKYTVYVSEWVKYGKNRTYLAVFETSDVTRHNAKIDCGYFDNIANEYVPGNVDIKGKFDLCGRIR